MLLDSNIIIYATQPQHGTLRDFVADHSPFVSVISYIEVLGYHRLADDEKLLLERFFDTADLLPLTDPIAQEAVSLRQIQRMSLGDSIIAATAIVHNLTVVTHNTVDFRSINGLDVVDPLG